MSLCVALFMSAFMQVKASADNHTEELPVGNYSVHIPAVVGNGDRVVSSYLKDRSALKWNHWNTYTDGKRDYVISVPPTTEDRAKSLLNKICDKDPNSEAIAFNQASGKGVKGCKDVDSNLTVLIRLVIGVSIYLLLSTLIMAGMGYIFKGWHFIN